MYSKGAFAESLGISRQELEALARKKGYSTTEEFYNATGGTGKTPQDTIDEIFAANQKQIELETGWVEDYLADNPYAFDEALARTASTEQFTPYYTEILNDYVTDIDTQRQSVQDDKRLNSILNDYNVAQTSRSYARAEEQAKQGYADTGMYFSGKRERDVGELGIERGEEMGRLGSQYTHDQSAFNRDLGTLDTSEFRKRRDIMGDSTTGRLGELGTAIEGGIQTRRGEALKGYWSPLVSTYKRTFPTSGGNALEGYVPEEYLRL
jgi:hypothetical protein